jgi:hypothetical protein
MMKMTGKELGETKLKEGKLVLSGSRLPITAVMRLQEKQSRLDLNGTTGTGLGKSK